MRRGITSLLLLLSLLLSATGFAEGKGCNIECMPENTCPTLNFNPDEIELEFDQFKCSEIQGIVLCTSTLTWVKEGRNPILHAWVVNTREDEEANLERIVIEDGLSNYGVIEIQALRSLKPVGRELKELEYINRMILEEQEKLQRGEISLEEYQENVQRIRECYSERIGELQSIVEEGRYNTEILEFSPREWPNPGENLLVRVVAEFELDGKELKLVKERRIRVASDFHEIWFEENHGRGKEVKLQQAQGFWASGDTHLHSVITCDWYEVGFTFDHIEQVYRGNLDFTFITDHSYDVENEHCSCFFGDGDVCCPGYCCCEFFCPLPPIPIPCTPDPFYQRSSEDPINGMDDDLDGLIDEDPEDILVNGKDIVDRDGDVYEFQMLKQECALRSDSEFLMIRGEEISARDYEWCSPFFGCIGADHYLGLGINGAIDSKDSLIALGADWYPLEPTPEEAIYWVNELGGLGFVAHPMGEPADPLRPIINATWDFYYTGPELANSSGVEALNSSFNWDTDYRGVKEFWEKYTRERGYRWTLLGGSDAHACSLTAFLGCPHLESLGTSFTVCHLEELTEEQVLSALREGRCFATNGPFLAIWGYDEGSCSPSWKLMSHETLYDYDNSLEIRARYKSDFALGEVEYLKIHWGIIGTNVNGTITYYPNLEGWDPYSDSVEIEIPWSSIVPPGSPPETTVYLYAEIVTEEDPPSQIGEAYIAVTNMLFFQKGICCLEYPKRLSSSSRPETSCQDGEDAEFQFPITNCGNTQVKVDFSISKPPNWDIWMNIQDTDGDGKPDVCLDTGETEVLSIRVSPPFSAPPSRALIGLGLEVQDDACSYHSTLEVSVEEVKGILLSHTYPERLYEVPLSEEMTQPHHLKLVNCGNVEEEIALRFSPEPGLIAWITDPFGRVITDSSGNPLRYYRLKPMESKELILNLNPMISGAYTLEIEAFLLRDPSFSSTLETRFLALGQEVDNRPPPSSSKKMEPIEKRVIRKKRPLGIRR